MRSVPTSGRVTAKPETIEKKPNLGLLPVWRPLGSYRRKLDRCSISEYFFPDGDLQSMEFPDDENGDVLQRMAANGDDLARPRNIDFTVLFPNEDAAQQFAKHFHQLGYAASVELTGTAEKFPWDVVIVKHMVPSHRDVGDFENELQTVADPLGGHIDGWGCFSEGI